MAPKTSLITPSLGRSNWGASLWDGAEMGLTGGSSLRDGASGDVLTGGSSLWDGAEMGGLPGDHPYGMGFTGGASLRDGVFKGRSNPPAFFLRLSLPLSKPKEP